MNRRDALVTGAAGLALSALASHAVAAAEPKTYRVGLIGAGWYGKNDLMRLIQVRRSRCSICDVDQHQATERPRSSHSGRNRRRRRGLMAIIARCSRRSTIDIVLVGTPDHWHALCAIAAMEAGADVYCQKPISRDVLEGEAMVAAARKHNKVVQVGTQRKLGPHLLDAKKNVIEAGLLGKIGQVDICCYFHMRANEQSARVSRSPISSITKCGPARRRCGRSTSSRTSAGGGRSWNTATGSWATCASTCST